MKVSPVGSTTTLGMDGQAAKAQTMQSLKMITRATPEQNLIPPAQELPISDDNKKTVENANPAEDVTQPLSPQYAAIAREKRALQRERRAFEDERKAFEVAKSQGGDSVSLVDLKSDPLGKLHAAGVTYDELAQAVLAAQGNPEIVALKSKLDSLEKGFEEKLTQREKEQHQAVLTEMKREAEALVSQGEEYELVKAMGAVPDAIRLIETVYAESGQLLSVDEALKDVENHLFERQQKLATLKKMQGLFQPPASSTVQEPSSRPAMRTLTNKDTASVPMTPKQRAFAAFYGTLKK